jgi:4-amino-4-deoxy-L-arabinose transferase-like glycosyltransferase
VSRAGRLGSWLARPVLRLLAEDRTVTLITLVFAASELVTLFWDLPGSHGWENDGVAPRDLFGGLAHNLTPGATHRYPLLHYLLLAVPSLPVLLAAVLAGPLTAAGVRARVLSVPVMTSLSVIAKLTATLMASISVLVLARIARRTGGERAGRYTALFAATNLTFAFYGRVSNLDVPYLMWTLLALDALLDIVERQSAAAYVSFGIFAALAVATKDQAYASFVLVAPLYLVLWPLVERRRFSVDHFKRLARAALVSAFAYGLASGALLNPRGFVRRLDELRGPSSQAWRAYSKDAGGLVANLLDAYHASLHDFWPPPVLALAACGVVVALVWPPGRSVLERRAARLAPLVAGLSSFVFFTLAVARAEHRFLLPLGLLLSVYGGYAANALYALAARVNLERILRPIVFVGLAWAGVASFAVHLTQLGDARREVSRFLAKLPRGSRVETYGLLVYQPHFDVSRSTPYRVTRVGPDPVPKRNPLVGARELEGDIASAPARQADVLVVSEGFANSYLTRGDDPSRPLSGIIAERQSDAATTRFVRAAVRDELAGYRVALVARPHLPRWARALGLEPVSIQATTGEAVWVLARAEP